MDALFDAAAAGDIEAVQRCMALPEVAANVATWNTNHRMRRLGNRFLNASLRPWFRNRRRDNDYIMSCVIRNGHIELLRWFFLPERGAILEEMMRILLSDVIKAIIKCKDIPAGLAMFEVVAESSLFTQIIDDGERAEVLVEAMRLAARKGRNELLRVLLAYGAEPNASSHLDMPIIAASNRGDAETVDVLLTHGASLDHEDLLIGGCWEGYVEMLVERGADVNALSSYYGSPLHYATEFLNERIELLYRLGADLDIRDANGRTPLLVARYPEPAKRLLDCGASIEAVDPTGRGVLHAAIEEWNIELAQFFLDHGANPNCQDVNGRTPLIDLLSRTRGDARKHVAEFINRMLEAGADPYLCDKEGISPAQLLERNKTGRAFMKARPHFFNSQ